MGAPVTRGGIFRGWGGEARRVNVRNFRFWLAVLFGTAWTVLGVLFAAAPFVRHADPILALPFGAVSLWIGASFLSLRASRLYDWGMGVGCLLIFSAAITGVVSLTAHLDTSNPSHADPLPAAIPLLMLASGVLFIWLCLWMADPAAEPPSEA